MKITVLAAVAAVGVLVVVVVVYGWYRTEECKGSEQWW